MARLVNRLGILAVHALIWTVPFSILTIAVPSLFPDGFKAFSRLNQAIFGAPLIEQNFYLPFERPSEAQTFYFQMAMSAIATLYFAGALIAGRLRRPRNLVLAGAVLFGLAALASSAGSARPMFTIKESLFLWAGILLLFMLTHLRLTPAANRRLLLSLIGVAGVTALIGILEYVLGSFGMHLQWQGFGYDPAKEVGRSSVLSVFGHPNYLTAFIGPSLLLIPALLPSAAGRPVRRVVLIALAIIISICIFIAGTRSAWLGVLLAGLAMLILVLRQGVSVRLTRRSLAVVGAIAALALLFAVPGSPLNQYSYVNRLASGRPVNARFYAYLTAVSMIKANPLLGVGYNNYGVEFWNHADRLQQDPRNRVFDFILEDMGGIRSDETHNEYLQIGAEMGLPGLAAFFFLLTAFFVQLREQIQCAKRRKDRLALAGIAGAVAFVLVDSLFNFPLHLPCSAMAFWLLLGIGSRYAVAETEAPARAIAPAVEAPAAAVAAPPTVRV